MLICFLGMHSILGLMSMDWHAVGYKIPRGGLFEYVSGANFFGEIVEWAGFAVASGSLPATAFALFTFANIGPRAIAHHQWYLQKFGRDYPPTRKALIPLLW